MAKSKKFNLQEAFPNQGQPQPQTQNSFLNEVLGSDTQQPPVEPLVDFPPKEEPQGASMRGVITMQQPQVVPQQQPQIVPQQQPQVVPQQEVVPQQVMQQSSKLPWDNTPPVVVPKQLAMPTNQGVPQSQVPVAQNGEKDLEIPKGAITFGKLGVKVTRYPVEKFHASVNNIYRIAVLSDDLCVVKIHFEPGRGFFFCFSGSCCENNGLPNVRYILPIIQYDTDKNGQPVSPSFEFKYLSLGVDSYTSLVALHQNVNIAQVDLIVTCSDEKYQKCSYQNVGQGLWRINPEFAKTVWEEFQRKWTLVPRSIARSMDEDKYNEASPVEIPQQQGSFNIQQFMKK